MRQIGPSALLSLIATMTLATTSWAENAAPAVAAPAAAPSGPSFQSAGVKMTLISLALSKGGDHVAVSAVITNSGPSDIAIAFVGPGLAVDNKGNSFVTKNVGGFADCGGGDSNFNWNGNKSKNTQDCITGKSIPFEQWTIVGSGQTAPGSFVFDIDKGDRNERGTVFSFSSTMAFYPVQNLDAPSSPDTLKGGSEVASKQKARMLSIGITSIPVAPQTE